MPVTETVLRTGASLKLNAGTNPSGGMKVVGVSLGHVFSDAPADKLLSIADALDPVLVYDGVRLERTIVTRIESE